MKTPRAALPVLLLLALSPAPVRGACALVVTGATISPVENAAFTGAVATFTGVGTSGEYTADVAWGDGGDSAATVSGTGPFTVTGTHTYRDEGSFTLTVKIHRSNGEVGTGTGTANVGDAPLAPYSGFFYATIGVPYNGAVGIFDDPAPHATASTNDNFVSQAYRDLLGRSATSGEISAGVTQLMSITRPQYAESLLDSTEGRSVAIDALYRAYLSRPVDGPALSAWLSFLSSGGTFDQLKANLIGSTEYFTNRSNSNNDCWADALYRDVLGRAIDVGGLTFIQGLLVSMTRVQVALVVLQSVEADSDLVNTWFEEVLHRAAMPTERSSFGTLLQMGTRDEVVLASIVGSAEYFAKLLGYAASIDWGDGNSTPGTVTLYGGITFTVSGSHTYSSGCSYPVVTTITEVGGAMTTTTFTVTLDATLPLVTAPAAATVTQTLCQ